MTTTKELSKEELKYQRKVKAVELAIKSQGNKGMTATTITNVAEAIFKYPSS